MTTPSRPRPRLRDRLWRDRRGNVMMIFGFAAAPLICATGIGVDYTNAMRIQSRLSAAADAAVLAATSQQLMSSSTDVARQRALDVFKITAGSITGLTLNPDDPAQVAITVLDTNGAANVRNATLTFRGRSHNSFGGILGISALTVRGTAGSMAKTAPDVDFYVLLDTSGSMALPTTSAGLKQLTSLTGGCAFACHSTNDAKAKAKNGTMMDYYGVARSYSIPLRVDEAKLAIQNMMVQARTTSSSNNAAYRAALYSFAAADTRANNSFTEMADLTPTLSTVSTAAGRAETSLYYSNSCPTSSFCNDDRDTASSDAFDRVNREMATPGNGTKVAGDRPQAVLFVVTDGMRDEYRPGGRPEVAIDTNLCATIKNRNIKIAVLYTEYLPESLSDNWSKTNVLPFLYKVEPALQSCATPGLYNKVSTDDDVSAALAQLFQRAVASARLVQ